MHHPGAKTRRGNAEVRVNPTVVPAHAGTHNHRPSLSRESRRTASLNTYDAAYGFRLARSLSSGARSRDPLAWPGRR